MHRNIGICVIADSPEIGYGVRRVIDQLTTALTAEQWQFEQWHQGNNLPHQVLYHHLLKQARDYLKNASAQHRFYFETHEYQTLQAAKEALSQRDETAVDLIIADEAILSPQIPDDLCEPFWELYHCNSGRVSAASFLLSLDSLSIVEDKNAGIVSLSIRQEDAEVWEMQVLKNLMDHLESAYINKLLARTLAAKPMVSSVAQYIFDYMESHFPQKWDFHFYTGSMISGFIDAMTRLSAPSAVRCASGPNEHSLAVSALCGWQLYQRGYVIAVTSGMIDEFRGTLYNLKRAQAPGIIVCADSPHTGWFPFQGTMHSDYDGRDTVAAKGIPYIYLDDKSTLGSRLSDIARLQQEHPGPVFVIATQPVLESVIKQKVVYQPEKGGLPAVFPREESEKLSEVVALLNQSKRRILWQCSHLSAEERDWVYRIAEKAGIALVDSIVSPGSVCDYHQQRPVNNYIGTLSVYGFSRKAYQYLHQDRQLAACDTQSLFFLKSKVDQVATPFSPGKLKSKCHIVQVNKKRAHISPYTQVGIVSALLPFLKAVYGRLDVAPEVLAYRQAELARVQAEPETMPVDWLPQLPMTPNYFYASLAEVLHRIITQDAFRYVGVYDVGRCGVSAIRNLPKTDKGFSGWYGRALMGDALMALPYLARTTTRSVIAFIGDGARALVPDVEQQIYKAFLQNPHRDKISMTVFYLCNGVLSMIQSYIDNRTASCNTKQVSLQNPHSSNHSTTAPCQRAGVRIQRERWERFEPQHCQKLLTQIGAIHFINVQLAHNSDGDGLSLLSEEAWHRINVA